MIAHSDWQPYDYSVIDWQLCDDPDYPVVIDNNDYPQWLPTMINHYDYD